MKKPFRLVCVEGFRPSFETVGLPFHFGDVLWSFVSKYFITVKYNSTDGDTMIMLHSATGRHMDVAGWQTGLMGEARSRRPEVRQSAHTDEFDRSSSQDRLEVGFGVRGACVRACVPES
jgi:hypothetical protein